MSTHSTLVLVSNDDLSQIKVDTGSPKESLESFVVYLNKMALGCNSGGAYLDMQMSDNANMASATLTVSSGAASDTAVVNGTTLTCVDHRETMNVTFGADSSGSLNSTYLTFQDQPGSNKYYIWFNINSAGVDPAVAGRTGIQVAGATGASAATLATAAVAACASTVGVSVSAGSSGHIIVRNNAPGTATATADGTAATGFSFSRTITGSAVSSSQYELYATDSLTAADLARAINANTSINPYVSAVAVSAVVTVTATEASVLGNAITLAGTSGVTANHARLAGGANNTSNIMHAGL